MKLGIVISSNDPETVWNAFRLGNSRLGRAIRLMCSCSAKASNASPWTQSILP